MTSTQTAPGSLREFREKEEAEAKAKKDKFEKETRLDKFFCAALTGLTADRGMGNDGYGHRGVVDLDLINIAWSYAQHAEHLRPGKLK